MTKVYKSFEDIDFDTLLTILQDDKILKDVDLQTSLYIYAIRNAFVQALEAISEDKYRLTFKQLCFIVLANMHLDGAELYRTLNLIYHNDYDDVIEDKPCTGVSLLARLTHYNKFAVDMFNEFSRSIARYRLPETSKTLTGKTDKDSFINDVIYIACKGDVSKLPVVYEQEAEDVLMFIEQETRKTYEIKRQSRL